MKKYCCLFIILFFVFGCKTDQYNDTKFTLTHQWKKDERHSYKMTYRKEIPSQKKRGTIPIDIEMYYTFSTLMEKRGNILVSLKLDSLVDKTKNGLDGEAKIYLASYGLDMILEFDPQSRFIHLENSVKVKQQMIAKMILLVGDQQANAFNDIDNYEQQNILESFFLRDFDFLFINYDRTFEVNKTVKKNEQVRAVGTLPSSQIETIIRAKVKNDQYYINKEINTRVDASSRQSDGALYVTDAAVLKGIEKAVYTNEGVMLNGSKSRSNKGGDISIKFKDGSVQSAPNLESTERWTIERI